MLLRVLVGPAHHVAADFDGDRVPRCAAELPLYAWADTTAREIAALVMERHEPARRAGARISLALVYPDRSGKFVVSPVGSLVVGRDVFGGGGGGAGGGGGGGAGGGGSGGAGGAVADVTLRSLKAQAGDYVDVAVTPAAAAV
jgi:hypothetical protein